MSRWALLFLVIVFALTLVVKIDLAGIGAPYVTIDDSTAYEAGFCVWFGNAPPQRMYLESWIIGATSILGYAIQAVAAGGASALGGNLVSDAYRDFYLDPDAYVRNYRVLIIAMDLLTGFLVYLLAGRILGDRWRRWAAVLTAAAYLLSYNTIWCDLVARPDTLTTLFSVLGLYFYARSDSGGNGRDLAFAAAAFGLATGMKLHALFVVVFVSLDLLRVHGPRRAAGRILLLALVSVVMFAIAAGSPLFDPLKYVKLRLLNARDDESPWIRWGDQVWVILRGSGWLAVSLTLAAVVGAVRRQGRRALRDPRHSVLFMALCWLLLFLSIRQMRAYWMLPALPLFYVAAIGWLSSLKRTRVAVAAAAALLAVLAWQSVGQVAEFKSTRFGDLRTWIVEHVEPEEPFFIFGYEAVELPKNAECLDRTASGIRRGFEADLESGMPFYERHVTQWEERSRLMLIDLLDDPDIPGYTYYSEYRTPLAKYEGIFALDEMKYLFVQDHFSVAEIEGLEQYLSSNCVKVAELTGPGGGGRGLGYVVYARAEGM